MRWFIPFAIFCMIIFSSSCIFAKFYKYKDKNGVAIFTDDLSQVPENLRHHVKAYESTTNNALNQKTKKNLKSPYTFTGKGEITGSNNEVEKQKKWFTREQQELNSKKEELMSLKKDINTPAKQKNYNDMVIKLNKRIDIFRQKLTRFNENLNKQQP